MKRMKNRNPNLKKDKSKKSNYRFLTIFVCIFVAAVLVFGATLGIITAVKNSKAVVKYKGVTMDGETASFFVTYYKYRYMSMLSSMGVTGVEDTKGFWDKIYESEEISYGELLTSGAKRYIREIMAANYLYDNYAKLSSDNKDRINSAVKEILTHKANGSKNTFNSAVSEYGFSYSSFKNAATMLYKASAVKDIIYGSNGANISNFPELAAEYLSQYSHVKLLFIRTETEFVLDENGNRVIGDDGNDETRPLTDEEKAERQALISEIRGYIQAIDTGGDVQMGEQMFDTYLENHDDGDENMHADGYYFHKNSSYTAEFSSAFGNVVNKAYQMPVNSYDEVTVDFGVCFIYKYIPTVAAYSSSLAEDCFTDFYSDAATYFFDKNLSEIGEEVTFDEKFSDIDIIGLPYNYTYYPNF